MKSFFLTPEQYADLKGRYAKFNEPWTADEAEELRQMAQDGVSREEMSTQLGRTPNAVKMKLQSLGLYVPKPAARLWTPEEGAILRRLILLRAAVLPDTAPAEAPGEAPVSE